MKSFLEFSFIHSVFSTQLQCTHPALYQSQLETYIMIYNRIAVGGWGGGKGGGGAAADTGCGGVELLCV